MEAAFKPQVNGELDTQNFMKFEEVSEEICTQYFYCSTNFSQSPANISVNKFTIVPDLDSLNSKACESTIKCCHWNILHPPLIYDV